MAGGGGEGVDGADAGRLLLVSVALAFAGMLIANLIQRRSPRP